MQNGYSNTTIAVFLLIKLKALEMNLKKFITNLFKDGNDINEKSIIGFASFFVMVIFACVDLITGYMGKQLVITEFIFNSFLIITLGAFGIASVDKFINSKYENKASNESETTQTENL